MAQILPPRTNLGSQIGEALGQGLEKGISNEFEYQRNLERSNQAFNKAREVANNPNATPVDLYLALSQAATQAGTPDAGRQIAAAFPLLLNQLQSQKASQTPTPGQQTIPGQQQTIPGKQQISEKKIPGQQIETFQQPIRETKDQLPIPIPEPSFTPYGLEDEGIELGQGPIPKTYSEEQYRQVNDLYVKSGLDPTPAINQMKLEDSISRDRLNDMIQGIKNISTISDIRRAQQEAFRGALKERLPNLDQDDLSIAETIAQSPEIRMIKNDKLRAERTAKEFNLFDAAKNNFIKNSERKDYDLSEYNRKKSTLGNYAKILIKYGQRDLAESILSKNRWGPVEISEMLNPLPKEIVSGISNLPKPIDILDQITVFPDDPDFDKQAEKAIKNREKTLEKYENYIEKNFMKGSYDPKNVVNLGTSLLQLRDESMKNGVTFQEFEKMMNNLISNGKIELDKYQLKDLPLLGEHPARSFSIGEIIWRLNPYYINRK